MDAYYRPAFSFRGAHVASGLLFAPRTDARDLDRTRARLLHALEPESRVYALDADIYAIVWSSPRRVDARFAPGALIVAHSGGLTAVPPAKGDPSLQTGELLTAHNGNLVIVTLERDRLVDPSEWIDVSAFELHAARTRARPAAALVFSPAA